MCTQQSPNYSNIGFENRHIDIGIKSLSLQDYINYSPKLSSIAHNGQSVQRVNKRKGVTTPCVYTIAAQRS